MHKLLCVNRPISCAFYIFFSCFFAGPLYAVHGVLQMKVLLNGSALHLAIYGCRVDDCTYVVCTGDLVDLIAHVPIYQFSLLSCYVVCINTLPACPELHTLDLTSDSYDPALLHLVTPSRTFNLHLQPSSVGHCPSFGYRGKQTPGKGKIFGRLFRVIWGISSPVFGAKTFAQASQSSPAFIPSRGTVVTSTIGPIFMDFIRVGL